MGRSAPRHRVAGVAAWTSQNTALAGNTDPWTVSEVNGKVWVDHDGTGWQALKTGAVLKRASRVKTGMGGRAVLKRHGESIAISPNSRFRIPTSDEKGPVAHFVQTLGTLLFKLQSRPDDPFNVRTPYLAAVIKGTTFTVTVDAEGAALHVSSGAVEVNRAARQLTRSTDNSLGGTFLHRCSAPSGRIVRLWLYPEVTEAPPEVRFQARSGHRCGKLSPNYGVNFQHMT